MNDFFSKLTLKKSKIDLNNVWSADFETFVYNGKHYVTCFSLANDSLGFQHASALKHISPINLESRSLKLLEEFLDLVHMVSNEHSIIIYIHNFSKFDAVFVLKAACRYNLEFNVIARNNIFYEIRLKNGPCTIFFRDSILLFPKPLSVLAQQFGLKKFEIIFDSNRQNYKNNRYIIDLLNYCLNDSFILCKSLLNFNALFDNQYKISIFSSLTLSSLSLKIFRTHYYRPDVHKIAKLNHLADLFIRQSFRGGIVDVYRPYLQHGYHYDVNSLYPFIMSKFEMPVGVPRYITIQNSNLFNIDSFFGFLEVEIRTPKDLYIPFLSKLDKEKGLISPLGTWRGIYFSEEIKYALSLGYQVSYLRGYAFEKRVIFDNFVTDLYNLRLKYKTEPLGFCLKLILNSLYGRFGMTLESSGTEFIDTADTAKLTRYESLYNISTKKQIYNKYLVKYSKNSDIKTLFTKLDSGVLDSKAFNEQLNILNKDYRSNIAVQISSAITSYARIEMHKMKSRYKSNLYYSDTDSLFTDIPIDDSLVSATELGKLKLEGIINSALFISPKMYLVNYIDTQTKKVKGINPQSLTEDMFSKLYAETPVTIKEERNFIRNLSTLDIQSNITEKKIAGVFKKRKKKYNTNGEWYDTSPLFVEK